MHKLVRPRPRLSLLRLVGFGVFISGAYAQTPTCAALKIQQSEGIVCPPPKVSYFRHGKWECIDDCPDGFGTHVDNANNQACMECTTGRFSNANQCQNCAAGKVSGTPGSTSCTACNVGQYQSSTGQSTCTLCELGKAAGATGLTACTPCAAGEYSGPSAGKAACTACTSGQYQSSTGQSTCTLCELGKYQSNPGQTTCKACPLGKAAGTTGKAACTACNVGQYQSSTGQSTCTLCAVGKAGGTNGLTACTPCAADEYSDVAGRSVCTACPSFTFHDLTGQTSVTSCVAPTFSTISSGTCRNPIKTFEECSIAASSRLIFSKRFSGTCLNRIQTASDCEAAARAVGLSDTSAGIFSSASSSPGCKAEGTSGNEDLYFNTNFASSGLCDASSLRAHCLCISPAFKQIDSLTCEQHGMTTIDTQNECLEAHTALGIPDLWGGISTASITYRASGCIGRLSFDNVLLNTGSTAECGADYWDCLCAIRPFESISSGKCESHGLRTITTTHECLAAHTALGIPDLWGGISTASITYRASGCIGRLAIDNVLLNSGSTADCGADAWNCLCASPSKAPDLGSSGYLMKTPTQGCPAKDVVQTSAECQSLAKSMEWDYYLIRKSRRCTHQSFWIGGATSAQTCAQLCRDHGTCHTFSFYWDNSASDQQCYMEQDSRSGHEQDRNCGGTFLMSAGNVYGLVHRTMDNPTSITITNSQQEPPGCHTRTFTTGADMQPIFNTHTDPDNCDFSRRGIGHLTDGCICRGPVIPTYALQNRFVTGRSDSYHDMSEKPPGCYVDQRSLETGWDDTEVYTDEDRLQSYFNPLLGSNEKCEQYAITKTGTCSQKVQTASDCEAAARALGLSDTSAHVHSSSGRPSGCYVNYGFLLFNTIVGSSNPCEIPNSADFCLCATPRKCLCGSGEYLTKDTGTCANRITNVADCEAAGEELGVSDTSAHVFHSASHVSGCYVNQVYLMFNTDFASDIECDSEYCLCKRAEYSSLFTGKCANKLQTASDCEAAARAVGISDTSASVFSSVNYAYGCQASVMSYGVVLWYNTNFASSALCAGSRLCLCSDEYTKDIKESTGHCSKKITTAENCESAASVWDEGATTASVVSTGDHPAGCHVDVSGSSDILYFNTNVASTTECDAPTAVGGCLCHRDEGMKPVYSFKESGTCLASGSGSGSGAQMCRVGDTYGADECWAAVQILTGVTDRVSVGSWAGHPHGCFVYASQGKSHYNVGDYGSNCGVSGTKCVCQSC